MSTLFTADSAHRRQLIFKLVITFAMTLALILTFANTVKAKTTYEITTEDATYTVESYADDVDSVLDEAGVDISATDLVSSDLNADADTVQVSVTHTQYAMLVVDGSVSTVQLSEGDTVSNVLEQLNVTLGKDDIVSAELDSEVAGGDTITVNRVEITYYDKTETGSFERLRQADPDSYRGTEYIKQEGKADTTTYHHKVTVIDGGEPVDEVVDVTTTDAVPEITAYGTRVSFPGLSGLSASEDYITNIDDEQKTITTASGSTYSFYSTKYFTCTAYTAKSGKHTSTGRTASVGVVAVDPSVIPYGTRMFIVSDSGSIVYGTAVAGDCGVKGQTIDLFYNSTSKCYSFGRRSMKVYFLN